MSVPAQRKERMREKKDLKRVMLHNIMDTDGPLRFDYWINRNPELKTRQGVRIMTAKNYSLQTLFFFSLRNMSLIV